MGFDFVTIGAKEIAGVLKVQERAYESFYQESVESFLSKIEFSPKTCYGVLDGDRLIGYGISFPWLGSAVVELNSSLNPVDENPNVLYIHDIAVEPEYRGLGIAKELLRLMAVNATLLGLNSVVLVAVAGSSTYWLRQGFIESEDKVEGYGEGALRMILTLR